jgi:glutathione S-transferase
VIELLGLPFSPWSEKARWALEARGVPFTFRTYAPLVGELGLRRKLGRWRGTVSVPVLTDDAGVAIPDSAAIARWADGHGGGPRMFPPGHEATVERFVELSERGLAAGRALSLRRLVDDRAAVRELVPRRLRWLPGSFALGRVGVRRTLRKYGGDRIDDVAHLAALTAVLEELRAALAPSRATILDELSFADIAIAQVLAYVTPPATGLRLGDANRARYATPGFAERYPDLVAWRDALYARHRGG